MSTRFYSDRYAETGMMAHPLIIAAILAFVASLTSVHAQASARNGREVVEKVCGACHTTGVNGAPKIGDKKAWEKRASQGLTSLTKNAIKGIRKMPPHGGDLKVTDLEIGRAITYMVNQSGGHWTEPADRTAAPAERSGEQIVKERCSKCHLSGVNGAPKIGDRDAWIPRLKQGFEPAVRAAIKGHGPMPARGGAADLSDAEMRRAIAYMLNPESAKPRQ
jgi:cytochrome c5